MHKREWLLKEIRAVRKKQTMLRARLVLASSRSIAANKEFKTRTTTEDLGEFIKRKDVKAVITTLKQMSLETTKDNTLADRTMKTAVAVASLILHNTSLDHTKSRKGTSVGRPAMALLRAVRIRTSEVAYNLLAKNLNLPHERTVRKEVAKNTMGFREGMHEENF
jgi:hypothetical protein